MVFIFVWRWLRNKQVLLTYRSGSAEYRSVIGRSTSYLATGSSRDAEHFIMWSILGPRKIKNKTVGDKHEVCFVRLSQLWQLNKPRDRQWMFYSLVDLGLPGSIIFTVYRNIINIGTVVLWGTVSRELMLVSVYPCNSRRAIAWHQYHFSNGLERYTMLSTKSLYAKFIAEVSDGHYAVIYFISSIILDILIVISELFIPIILHWHFA